ncbi:MAG: type I-U CRISPR-associated protein Csx17 [Acidobacteria bacterium]|nr:type I-U CRISPR-associated protein Csx17 [Acidobacteriota bacterium]
MSYLKALGILRLVSEQKDRAAAGRWHNGIFELRSVLDETAIVRFLKEEYQPTPIIVPWSGKDFFSADRSGNKGPYKKTPTAERILEAFLAGTSHRLSAYRRTILLALDTLEDCGIRNKDAMKDGKGKARFLSRLRATAPDEVVEWIDVCAAISSDRTNFSSLLGSGGGSDGNTHFSDNFMQNLWEVLPEFDSQRASGTAAGTAVLRSALFATQAPGLVPKRTSSLYDAGAVGGPNAGQGFERDSIGNPWNFILCLEGTFFLAGCVARRHGAAGARRASFPFQVRLAPTRGNALADKESAGSEAWMPLWPRWASNAELATLFSEGRASIGTRQVGHSVDFARAAASLGVDRGIDSFQRFAVVRGRVGGDNYNTSASLGRFEVRLRSDVDLLQEIDPWLDRLRDAVYIKEAPPRFRAALRRIQSCIFEFCQYGGSARFAAILRALGCAERELATGEKFRSESIRPLAGLSPQWIDAAFDGSLEFELALSLSGIRDAEGKIGPFRANVEPVRVATVKQGKPVAEWIDRERAVVWAKTALPANLAAVLERRLMDGARMGCVALPLSSRRNASLDAVAAFMAGMSDDALLEELLWGLVLVDQDEDHHGPKHWGGAEGMPLPRIYALLRLLFLPWPLESKAGPVDVRPEPGLLGLLRAGRTGDACALAVRRLRAGGLLPMGSPPRGPSFRGEEWRVDDMDPRRLAAALLFPIAKSDVIKLAHLVLRTMAAPVEAAV